MTCLKCCAVYREVILNERTYQKWVIMFYAEHFFLNNTQWSSSPVRWMIANQDITCKLPL